MRLEDERKLDRFQAVQERKTRSQFFDVNGEIPGTMPEKMVYHYLMRLKINFEFQYHLPENFVTKNPESDWQPDFLLPDYHNTLIEVYGTYWHRLNRTSDQTKKAYWLLMGYTVIEQGIPTRPASGYATGGKAVIWWENEIYGGIDRLISRDLPELHQPIRKGSAAEYLLDAEKEFNKIASMRARMKASKVRPKYVPASARYQKLVRKKYGR
jgi:hypothetical protein